MDKVTLITNRFCPFARKAAIALREKTNDFTLVDEDLQNKSEFFKQSYSRAIGKIPGRDGAVPTLIDGETYLTESQPVVWYIAEKFQNIGYNLIPQDHAERFKMRLFIEDFSKKISGVQSKFFGWPKKSEEDKNKIKQESAEFLQKLNNSLILPYALGEQFTVADILLYTHLQRWNAIEHFTQSGIDEKNQKIHQYISEVQKRQSVKDLVLSKEAYIAALGKFFS